MKCKIISLQILITVIVMMSLCEARGGRRGGSFGGVFGSWRKYKKPSTGGGNSRRIVSSSPVHTPVTKALHENKKTNNNEKFQKNLKTNNYYNNYNTPALPVGGSYYHNAAALPGNAIYVAQAPPRGSEIGDFLTGYLTGRLLTMGFTAPHYHVTHVYKENTRSVENNDRADNSSSKGFIVNGQPQALTSTQTTASFTETSTTTERFIPRNSRSTTTQLPLSTDESIIPPLHGVICIPMVINETNANGEAEQNERIVCYPAPAPPTPQKDMKSKPVEIAGDIMNH